MSCSSPQASSRARRGHAAWAGARSAWARVAGACALTALAPLAAAEPDASRAPYSAEIRHDGFLDEVSIIGCQFSMVTTHSYECVQPSQGKIDTITADLGTVGEIEVKPFDGRLMLTFEPRPPSVWGGAWDEDYDASHVIEDCQGRESEQIENNTLRLFLPLDTDRAIVEKIVERHRLCSGERT